MLANFVKETISAGGTGALTLSGKVAGFIDFNAAVGVDKYFNYTIEDGNNREVGIGHITTSTNLVRDTVLETLVAGTLDRTSPTAINATTAAEVMIAATASSFGKHRPHAFVGAGFAGIGPMLSKDCDTNKALVANYMFMFPTRIDVSQQVDTIAAVVNGAAASSEARFALYEIDSDGEPGKRLINFTETTTIDTTTTGTKSQAADAPAFIPAGDYFLGITTNSSTVTWKKPQYAGSFTFLGTDTGGKPVSCLFRSFTYAEMPADESASSWTESVVDYYVTHWIS